MSIVGTLERTVLEAAVARYKAEGFDVIVEPSPVVLPPFLQNYRPDAIALRAGRKIALEVVRSNAGRGEKAKHLSERISENPDWELAILYVSPGAATERIEIASRGQISRALEQVMELHRAGQQTAALVMGWATLEAIARALLPERLARPQPAAELLEALAAEGYLTPSEADGLRKAALLRNAAAHGQLAVAIEARQIDELVASLSSLAGYLPKNAA